MQHRQQFFVVRNKHQNEHNLGGLKTVKAPYNHPTKNLTPNLQTSQIWRIFVSKLANYATDINHRRNKGCVCVRCLSNYFARRQLQFG